MSETERNSNITLQFPLRRIHWAWTAERSDSSTNTERSVETNITFGVDHFQAFNTSAIETALRAPKDVATWRIEWGLICNNWRNWASEYYKSFTYPRLYGIISFRWSGDLNCFVLSKLPSILYSQTVQWCQRGCFKGPSSHPSSPYESYQRNSDQLINKPLGFQRSEKVLFC